MNLFFINVVKKLKSIFVFLPLVCFARDNNSELRARINSVVSTVDGKVGVGVWGLDFSDSLLINDNCHFPMQSVYKVPLAIYILHLVDNKKLSLNQVITIKRNQLREKTWSPMLKDFKEERYTMTLAGLLRYSISQSDNNACDILFRLSGGTKATDDFFKMTGIGNISIAATEQEMHREQNAQYTNWSAPSGMLDILRLLYEGKLLTPESNSFLMKLMVESKNSANRLKGLLPGNAVVAHKTGTGNTNEEGRTSATNDAGIITLPNGKHYAIAVFVSDYKGGIPYGEKIIATISKTVWDYFSEMKTFTKKLQAPVSATTIKLFDSSRNRPVDIAIYQSAANIGKYKGIVFLNHGYDPANPNAYLSYSYIANFLAERKYLVVSVQHDLLTDKPIPFEGNVQVVRRPYWETGVTNLKFVISFLRDNYPKYSFEKVSLIGHSYGGDIAALFATEYPEMVQTLITLDNLRVALPRRRGVHSLRSSDQTADNCVLPTEVEQHMNKMKIIQLPSTKHNDMGGNATPGQQAEINSYIYNLLNSK